MFAKLNQPNVPDVILAERKLALAVNVLDRVHLDVSAGKFVFLNNACGRSDDRNGDLGTRLAAKLFHRLRKSKLLRTLAVDFDDAIAGKNSRLEPWCIFHRRDDGEK